MSKLSRAQKQAVERFAAALDRHIKPLPEGEGFYCPECRRADVWRDFFHKLGCQAGKEIDAQRWPYLKAMMDKRTTPWRRFRCQVGWHKRQGMIDFSMGREYWRCEWCGKQKTTYPTGDVDWDERVNGPQSEGDR